LNLLRIILHAALVPALFMVAQSASAAVNTARASQASAEHAAVSDKKQRQRDRSDAPAAAAARRNTEVSPPPGVPRDTGKADRSMGQAARANSDRVRSLLNGQTLRPRAAAASHRAAAAAAGASGQTVAPSAAAGAPRTSGNPGLGAANASLGRANPSQARATQSQGPALAAPSMAARRAAVALPQISPARIGTLGGPRAQGFARLGGPASGNAAHGAIVGGAHLRRR
jgi:cytoskeletal protein RodZ